MSIIQNRTANGYGHGSKMFSKCNCEHRKFEHEKVTRKVDILFQNCKKCECKKFKRKEVKQ